MVAAVGCTAGVVRGACRHAFRSCKPVSISARAASTSSFVTQNPYYPLYPSVHQLLAEKGIPPAEIHKIRATGPKGRLLKGDVLSYTGAIDPDASLRLAQTIAKRTHLDLSDVKLASSQPSPPPDPSPAAAPVEGGLGDISIPPFPATPAEPKPTVGTPELIKVSLRIPLDKVFELQKKLALVVRVILPLEHFVVKAGRVANQTVKLSSSSRKPVNDDALFNEILGIQTAGAPAYRVGFLDAVIEPVEEVATETVTEEVVERDIIDELTGAEVKTRKKTVVKQVPRKSEGQQERLFTVEVPPQERARGEEYLLKMKELLQDPVKLMTEL